MYTPARAPRNPPGVARALPQGARATYYFPLRSPNRRRMHYNDRPRPRTLLGGLAAGLALGALAAAGWGRFRRRRPAPPADPAPAHPGVRRFRL